MFLFDKRGYFLLFEIFSDWIVWVNFYVNCYIYFVIKMYIIKICYIIDLKIFILKLMIIFYRIF